MTSYVVLPVISMWLSSMTMNGKKTVIIYSSETIYQTLISLKASLQENGVSFFLAHPYETYFLSLLNIIRQSIIFKLYSPCYPVNITFQGTAAQLSPTFCVLFIKF